MNIRYRKDLSGQELIRLLILLSIISMNAPHTAMGESTSAIGLSSSETITRLGFPAEKIEKESKRESQWSFFNGRVLLLREGIVVREEWENGAEARADEQANISQESSHSEFIFSGNELLSAMKQIEEETKTTPASKSSINLSGPLKRQAR
ncbi:MAG: hypothetical protein ACO3XO_00930 [Bdellovibrionota bacterium]